MPADNINRCLNPMFVSFFAFILLSMDQQDEYEELLRYAVVTPKMETFTSANMQRLSTSYLSAEGRTPHRKDDGRSQRTAGGES